MIVNIFSECVILLSYMMYSIYMFRECGYNYDRCSGNVVVYIHIQENDCIYIFRECGCIHTYSGK